MSSPVERLTTVSCPLRVWIFTTYYFFCNYVGPSINHINNWASTKKDDQPLSPPSLWKSTVQNSKKKVKRCQKRYAKDSARPVKFWRAKCLPSLKLHFPKKIEIALKWSTIAYFFKNNKQNISFKKKFIYSEKATICEIVTLLLTVTT